MSASPGQTSGKDTAIGCVSIVVLALIIAIAWAGCGACQGGDDGGDEGDSGSGGGQPYTLSDYNMIDVGMSRSDVESILGGPGEAVDGYPDQRVYINDDGFSNIVIAYSGDVVVDKAQAGL